MRTTLAIDDNLLAAAKERAAARRQTLGEYVEDAVRRSLVEPEHRSDPVLPIFSGGGGVRPGVDLTSNRSMYDVLDSDRL